ncbi:head-tail joining protein [Oceanibacterium hippocampi]|uniref:Uncharacterized protein n=1 Tax=Oceanibacterium hippocampi TaxID=745714 RepID=A0A1Y5S3E1_9PROT|nr:hypothetical protein [Oceanibacterium hippocampi]SLN31766.1 hypothetical protein OCH7691_01151 [Oceanibacterium hippocampi]
MTGSGRLAASLRRAIARAFDSADDLAPAAILRRVIQGGHVPGEGAPASESDSPVRVLLDSAAAASARYYHDLTLEPGDRIAWLESTVTAPRNGDRLIVGGVTYAIRLVDPADAGAGALYRLVVRG